MATTVPPFRIVRCPRCKKLLTEFANVPVYQCGECGTTLRAKHYNATRKDIIVPLPENRPDCGSMDNGLQSKNETAVCATNDRVQSADSPNPQSSSVLPELMSDLRDINGCLCNNAMAVCAKCYGSYFLHMVSEFIQK